MHAIEPASSPILHAPVPRVPIAVRVATTADLPFMDSLQKAHSKQLGYFPTKQFEGYIEQGTVLIAETTQPRRREDAEQCAENPADDLMFVSAPPRLRGCISTSAERVGYVIAKDRYLKRDELGVVYQLCVAPGISVGRIKFGVPFKPSASAAAFSFWAARLRSSFLSWLRPNAAVRSLLRYIQPIA